MFLTCKRDAPPEKVSNPGNTYWTIIPAEMRGEICFYLDTYQTLLTCSLFPDLDLVPHSFFKKIRLVAEIRLQRDTQVFDYLTHPDRNMLVVSLDISNNYWIPGHCLKKLVEGLPNLRCVFAFDTKLRWHKGWKFETVGLTYCNLTAPLPEDMDVDELYLHIDNTSFGSAVSCALQISKVKNLHFHGFQVSSYLARSKRLVFSLKSTRSLTVSFTNLDINVYFMEKAERWFIRRGWVVCKRVYEDMRDTFSWYDFNTPPNFNWALDEERRFKVREQILEAQNLKTLIIPWGTSRPEFPSKSVLTMFLDWCPHLEELVIMHTDESFCNAVPSITGFVHLQSLHLIGTTSGPLLHIFKNCTKLKSFTFWSANFMDYNKLYAELSYAKSLKDLTLKMNSVDVKELLQYIPKTVTRVMLNCKVLTNMDDLENLLETNPQFIFFGVCLRSNAHIIEDKQYIKHVMESCKHSPAQFFIVWEYPKDEISMFNDMTWNINAFIVWGTYTECIPELHYDMIYNHRSAVYSS